MCHCDLPFINWLNLDHSIDINRPYPLVDYNAPLFAFILKYIIVLLSVIYVFANTNNMYLTEFAILSVLSLLYKHHDYEQF